jgi:YidC/Oxa1 family membrane protein insertase
MVEHPRPEPALPSEWPAVAQEQPSKEDVPRYPAEGALSRATHAVLENDAVRLRVSSLGGRLESIQLKRYRAEIAPESGPVELVTIPSRGTGIVLLGEGQFRGLESIPHSWVSRRGREARLEIEKAGARVERTVTLDDEGYGGWVRVRIQNRGSAPMAPQIQMVWYGAERPGDAPDRFQNYEILALVDGALERRRVSGLGSAGLFGSLFGRGAWTGESYPPSVEWAGVASQYFVVAAVIENPAEGRAFMGPLGPNQGISMLSYPPFEVPPGRQLERRYRVYFGPKLEESVVQVDPRLAPALRVGWAWIAPLVRLFEGMLGGTYRNLVPNYGVAIILLTILLRLVTYPLTQKSMKSMRRFSEIAPAMKEVQGKFKDDKARQQQEMMALYQRKGINPLAAMGGGCLPMLIQFPFLIALYFALQGSIELRHAHFFWWIRDLSAPETLFQVAGIPIRLLPLMMGATMVLQQRLTPTAGVDPQQRQMMTWMSVLFIFLFYQFPSGLVLYWFVSNLLGIGQQFLVNRQVGPPPAAAKQGD